MPIEANLSACGRHLTLQVSDKLALADHRAFSDAYEKSDPRPEVIEVDMKSASIIDSSGLGLLLILREFALQHTIEVRLINCEDQVLDTLLTSNFSDLFVIG